MKGACSLCCKQILVTKGVVGRQYCGCDEDGSLSRTFVSVLHTGLEYLSRCLLFRDPQNSGVVMVTISICTYPDQSIFKAEGGWEEGEGGGGQVYDQLIYLKTTAWSGCKLLALCIYGATRNRVSFL
jgi:hypothetical protein